MSSQALCSPPAGCQLQPLTREKCQQYLDWLLGQGSPPEDARQLELRRALAHCDDGVTWGRYDAQADRWQLGDQFPAGISPTIRPDRLQQLRLFGPGGEVLLWRSNQDLQGRVLQDASADAAPDQNDSLLRLWDQELIVRGDRVVQGYENFTHVDDRVGAEQLLPLAVTADQLRKGKLRLVVRHYFQQDDTGAVRIAASRLVDLCLQ